MTIRRTPLRIPRAAFLTAIVFALAASAHVLAGGALPAAPINAAVGVVLTLCTLLLTCRKLTAPDLVGFLAVGQVFLHFAFSVWSVPATVGGPGVGHHMSGAAPAALPNASALHEHLAADTNPAMLLLHTAATMVTALILAHGEAALWMLATWLRPLHGLPATITLPAPTTVATNRRETTAKRILRPSRPSMRGPPLANLVSMSLLQGTT